MSGFARWLQQNRLPRVAVLVVSFLLPLTNVISAALLVMTARAAGARAAGIDVAAGLALLALLLAWAGGGAASSAPIPALFGASVLWGGAVAAGLILRRFASVDLAVQALVVLVLLGVVAACVVIPDSRAHWQPVLQELFKAAGLPQVDGLPPGWLGTLASLMHGVIGASVLSTLLIALMLGLWFDPSAPGGAADGPGWRRLFLELRLGRVLSLVAAVAVILLALGLASLGGGLLMVLGTAFAAQGLAVLHWTAQERQWPRIWPLVIYAPLVLGAPSAGLTLLALAVAGLVDNGIGLRRPRTNVV